MSDNHRDQIEALESQLHEKDELVAALTERLEQAAEQLDRLHRSGADRRARASGGGVPAELIERQKTVLEGLEQAVERWERMQAESALERLESQVSELRDLVAGGTGHAGLSRPPGQASESASLQAGQQNAATEPTETESSGESPSDAYAAMKAALLEDDSSEAETTQAESTPPPNIQEELQKIDPVDPPEQIDLWTAEPEQLRAAVEERDTYIGWLIQRLRVFETCRRLPDDWEALNDVPEELRSRLESLEHQLEETLRLSEVEHSLERARLSREETRIKQMEQQLQKETRRLGLEHIFEEETEDDTDRDLLDEEWSDEDEDSNGDPSRSGGWLNFLGRRKNADAEELDEVDDA